MVIAWANCSRVMRLPAREQAILKQRRAKTLLAGLLGEGTEMAGSVNGGGIPKEIALHFVMQYQACRTMEDVRRLDEDKDFAQYNLLNATRRADLLKKLGLEEIPSARTKILASESGADNEISDGERAFENRIKALRDCKKLDLDEKYVRTMFEQIDFEFNKPENSRFYGKAQRRAYMDEFGIREGKRK
jgi:hypothetical protein